MSFRCLLDTDTVSFALRGVGRVGARILARHPSELSASTTFFASVAVLPFEVAAARRFGAIGSALARAGTPIGRLDTLIAAHAASQGLILVSNNTRHFHRVRGLRVEDRVGEATAS